MTLYIVRVPSGHDWIVEADSTDAALENWPAEVEDPTGIAEPSIDEVRRALSTGESDVGERRLRRWLMAREVSTP